MRDSQLQDAVRNGVAVIIPCYNQGRFLAESIESVLGQNHPADAIEIIVIDDGSTDDTAEVAASFGARVRYFHQQNAGPSVARNRGILAISADFVLFLDADDFLTANAIKSFTDSIARNPNGDVFYANWDVIYGTGRPTAHCTPPHIPEDAFHAYLMGMQFPTQASLIRRSVFARAGFWDTSMDLFEDWELFIRIALAGAKFVYVPETVVVYREHMASRSKHYWRAKNSALDMLRWSCRYHTGCERCRESLKWGRRGVRVNTFRVQLGLEVQADWQDGRKVAAVGKIAHALAVDPILVANLIQDRVSRLKQAAKRISKQVLMPAASS